MALRGLRRQTSLGLALLASVLVPIPSAMSAGITPREGAAATTKVLEALRDSGDLHAQRHHAWLLLLDLSQNDHGTPRFESWHGESEIFGTVPVGTRGIHAFAPRTDAPGSTADIPVISYTLYNEAAYAHIRKWGLNRIAQLRRLRAMGPPDSTFAEDRAVPTFPAASMVLKSVWWPAARDALTALPVWDAKSNPPRASGNGYTSWKGLVAVVPQHHTSRDTAAVNFMGQTVRDAPAFALDAFYYVVVDAAMAKRLMADSEAQRTILMALGRPIRAGDYLLLVGANLATKEIADWVWAAYWWSDRPTQGPFALDRPPGLLSVWRNYMMQVAFDAQRPLEADSSAHICFNPWLEGRFPDGGQGSGVVSNCQACHRRASFPALGFLPVTRGDARRTDDPAYAPGRLRTGFLWSIALHAR